MIERAYEIACLAHAGQVDKGGHDYIEHPLAVYKMLDTEEEKIVGLLHDVLEDGDKSFFTLDEIREEFGDTVADAVDAVTHREGEEYFDYLARLAKNKIAVRVKLADLTHNSDLSRIEHPTEKDYARVEKYKKAKQYLMEHGA